MEPLRRILFSFTLICLIGTTSLHRMILTGHWKAFAGLFLPILCVFTLIFSILLVPCMIDEIRHIESFWNYGQRFWSVLEPRQLLLNILIWLYPIVVIGIIFLSNLLIGKGFGFQKDDFGVIMSSFGVCMFGSLALFYRYIFMKSY